jgi:hypothetical protein
MRVRTKVLMWFGALFPFIVIMAILFTPEAILYYERSVGRRRSDFIVVHYHLSAFLFVWVLTVVGAVISLLFDKKESGQS